MTERIRWSWLNLIEWVLDRPFVLRDACVSRGERFRRDGWVIGQRLLDIPYTLRIRFSRRPSGQAGIEEARRPAELHAELDARAAAVARGEAALAVGLEEVELRTRQLDALAQTLAARLGRLEEGETKLDRSRARAEERAELRRVALEQRERALVELERQQDELTRQARSRPVEQLETAWWEKQLGATGSGTDAPVPLQPAASRAK